MKRGANPVRRKDEQAEDAWRYDSNPAVRELLDHIAQELAREYVRLMKEAPEEDES